MVVALFFFITLGIVLYLVYFIEKQEHVMGRLQSANGLCFLEYPGSEDIQWLLEPSFCGENPHLIGKVIKVVGVLTESKVCAGSFYVDHKGCFNKIRVRD